MPIFQELKRRNVFRVAVAYVVAAWVITEVSSLVLEIYESPDSVIRIIVALLAVGLPFALLFAWAFEVTPEGIKRESEVDSTRSITQFTAKRLDMVTIALVVVAAGIFSVDRLLLVGIDATEERSTIPDPNVETPPDAIWTARQLIEIDRLRDLGQSGAAFALATKVEPLLEGDYDVEEFWAGFSWPVDIDSDPQGAKVYRQQIGAGDSKLEDLGTTPLKAVRFADRVGYRMRFELDGYRSVELLHETLWRPAINPVRLDPEDTLPEEMVRMAEFTHDLVEYGDYFMDRFEITNREYQEFVSEGGYLTPDFWTHPFVKDGSEISWEDAVANFIDRSGRPGPSTWSGSAYPDGRGDYPVNGVSWYEAAAYANFVEKELPTTAHQEWALRFYRENSWLIQPRSNFGGDGPWPVGQNLAMTSMGVYDFTGNVREWLWNEMGDGKRATAGGAWTDAPYHSAYIIPKSPWDRDTTHGFRLVRTFDSTEKINRLRQPHAPFKPRDFRLEEPATDLEFEIYRSMYVYDPLPLNSETVSVDTFEYWTRERVEFDLPSGERGAALLYTPKHTDPPFETVVFWPGSGALEIQSVDDHQTRSFDFLVRNGRAVVKPIFWGTYDRDDSGFSIDNDSVWPTDVSKLGTQDRDLTIKWVQELSRTIDYLETRDDIDSQNLGFFGFSWGGHLGPIALVIEESRLNVAVLNVGGLDVFYEHLPEVDTFNFVPRIKVPILMINGEYDIDYPFDSAQQPMYDRLGTDPDHKKLYVTPDAHFVQQDILIRETLSWFDHYLSRQNTFGDDSQN